jgi:hypothetical protein
MDAMEAQIAEIKSLIPVEKLRHACAQVDQVLELSLIKQEEEKKEPQLANPSIKSITDTIQGFLSGSTHILHSYQKFYLLESMGSLTPDCTSLKLHNAITKEEFKDALQNKKQVLFLMRVGQVSIAAFIKTNLEF